MWWITKYLLINVFYNMGKSETYRFSIDDIKAAVAYLSPSDRERILRNLWITAPQQLDATLNKEYRDLDEEEKMTVCKKYAKKFCNYMSFQDKIIDSCIEPVGKILDTYWLKNIKIIFTAMKILYRDLFIKQLYVDETLMKIYRSAYDYLDDDLNYLVTLCCEKKLSQDEINSLSKDFLEDLKWEIEDYKCLYLESEWSVPSLATLVRTHRC